MNEVKNTHNLEYKTVYNSKNERLKWKYFEWAKQANRKSGKTIDISRRAILIYENYHQFKDLEKIATKQTIMKFKEHYQKQGKGISTQSNTLKSIQNFYRWLATESGYKSKINVSELEYFNLSNNEMMSTKKTTYKPFATMEQLKKVVENMPYSTELQKRDRALMCFCVVSGIRVEAITSLQLKHIDIDRQYIYQDGEEVKTKFGKTIHTFFFPIDNLFIDTFIEWYHYLIKDKLYGIDAPLFPKALYEQDENNSFKYEHVSKDFWTSTGQIRNIFKNAFEGVGIKYHNPHSIRKTLEYHFKKNYVKDLQKYQALSLNFGHSNMMTTLGSYGNMSIDTQEDIFNQLKQNQKESNNDK